MTKAHHGRVASVTNYPMEREEPRCVPLLDLSRQYDSIATEVLDAVGRVCASQQYILGKEVESLEREIAAYCGAREAVGCASGTDALWLSLAAVGVQAWRSGSHHAFQFFRISQRHCARWGSSRIYRYRSAHL